MKKNFILFELIPILATLAGILGFGIAYGQVAIKLAPVCISLVVMLFNARANRWGFILGGLNSILYAVGFVMEGLYGSLLSTCFGAVMQFVTFFFWKRRAYGKATMFRRMKGRTEILCGIGFLLAWLVAALVLRRAGGTEFVLDSMSMLLGFVLPILTMFAYLESLPLNLVNMVVSLALWIRIVAAGNLANLTYLVYSVYCAYMTVRQTARWVGLYREQRAEKKENAK